VSSYPIADVRDAVAGEVPVRPDVESNAALAEIILIQWLEFHVSELACPLLQSKDGTRIESRQSFVVDRSNCLALTRVASTSRTPVQLPIDSLIDSFRTGRRAIRQYREQRDQA
jgi:hypothetical protein